MDNGDLIKRKIFKYSINGKTFYEDPLEIENRFNEALEFEDPVAINSWLDYDSHQNIQLYTKGLMKIKPVIAKAFNLPPLNRETGEGMTTSEMLEIWGAFRVFQEDVKKNTEL